MPTNDRETATGTTEAGEAGPTVRVRESKEDFALRGVPTVGGTERQQEMRNYASLSRHTGLSASRHSCESRNPVRRERHTSHANSDSVFRSWATPGCRIKSGMTKSGAIWLQSIVDRASPVGRISWRRNPTPLAYQSLPISPQSAAPPPQNTTLPPATTPVPSTPRSRYDNRFLST